MLIGLCAVILLLVLFIMWREFSLSTVGEINILESDDKIVYTLDLTKEPEALEHKNRVIFKVNRKVKEESQDNHAL